MGHWTTIGRAALLASAALLQASCASTCPGEGRDLCISLLGATRGTTIGYRKLDRFEPVSVSAVRLTIEEAIGDPGPVEIALY